MAATHQVFTRRQKLFVVGSAIFAVLVSLAFAAWIIDDAFRNMQFSQQDQEVVNRLSGDAVDPLHQSILRAHAIDAVANLKQLANRQSIIVVAFAGAFALSVVGFALFLLGADGAFQLQAEQGGSGLKLLLAGTAPGIVCFVLAVVLVGMAIAHWSSVNLASAYFPKQSMGPSEKSAPRSPTVADTARNAESRRAMEAAGQPNAAQEAQNRAAEKAATAKLAADKVAADKLIADELAATKAAVENAAIAKLAAEKAAAAKLAAQKAADQKAADTKLAALKAAAAKSALDRASTAKSAADRASAAKVAADRAAADKLAVDRARADKAGTDKAAADKLAAFKAASNKLAADKAAGDTARAEKGAADRVDVASLTAERIAAAGAPSEIYKRAVALRNEGETSQALALLRYASSTGHGPSSRLLAALYRDGAPDVRANFRQAEKYQALADSQGNR